MNAPKILLRFAAILLLALLAACSTPQVLSGRAFHSFSFDASRESVGIEVLFYRYGSAPEHGFRTTQYEINLGRIAQSVGVTGDIAVGDDLYVKWRNKATGKVYEDTVDLKSRLPFSMHKQELHFIIEGPQLYVYLISFDPVRDVMSMDEVDRIRRMHKTPRQKAFSFHLRDRVIQIYPVKLIDPHLPPQPSK